MKKRHMWMLLVLVMCLFAAVPASAKWVKEGNGYVYYTSKGQRLETIWVAAKNAGMVKVPSGDIYCILADGTYFHGCMPYNGKSYYFNSKGLLVRNKWIKGTSGRMFHTDHNGALLVSRLAKIGGNMYAFDKRGAMIIGAATINKKTYFFKNDGTMVIKQLVKTRGKYFYFQEDGTMVVSVWIGRYYFGPKGWALTDTWKSGRYLGSDGKYCVGLTKVGNDTYYFEKNGKKVTSASKTVNGKTYYFDENGKAVKTDSRYESTYYTDPKVSDEVLMSAILYTECGNQPYYGQLAVALVITNRMRSNEFPNTLKEVIYAKQQFEPARNGALTRALKNPAIITDSCKKAAKVALKAYPLNKYYTTNEKGKRISMEGYYFFMTPAAYARLGLKSPILRLKDHVFFKRWIR